MFRRRCIGQRLEIGLHSLRAVVRWAAMQHRDSSYSLSGNGERHKPN